MDNSFPILIAEDDPVSRRMLEKNLVKAGRKVVSTSNGREALESLKKNYYPIVITDWMMPVMDGLELCQAIRKQKFPGYVFVVLLTARAEKCDIIAGLDAGADDYLTKPFNQAELVARIKAGERVLNLERSLSNALDEIKKLSITDPLTKCYNRGYLMEHLSKEIKRNERYKHSLHISMIDIDHFKKINDTYGHQAGDLVLQECVSCIMDTIREGADWLARYGGEEFILVLPETDLDKTWKVVERIRCLIAEMVIPLKGEEIKITASFGISGFGQGIDGEEVLAKLLIEKADKCLYEAKETGRNRIVGEGMNERSSINNKKTMNVNK